MQVMIFARHDLHIKFRLSPSYSGLHNWLDSLELTHWQMRKPAADLLCDQWLHDYCRKKSWRWQETTFRFKIINRLSSCISKLFSSKVFKIKLNAVKKKDILQKFNIDWTAVNKKRCFGVMTHYYEFHCDCKLILMAVICSFGNDTPFHQ